MNTAFRDNRAILIWLGIVCLMIFAMVVVGGITRLTDSGLSMVDWRPIMGAIPPLSQDAWQSTFSLYQQYPEYQQHNQGMTLAEFKFIFFWEYGHRLLGRTIGLVFFIPLVIFWLQGRLNKALKFKLSVAFLLGGAQGVLGWYMVMSGLVDEPRVSQYRLAAHLSLALFLLGYLFWVVLDLLRLGPEKSNEASQPMVSGSFAITVLVVLQIIYGAFTAGLKAGWGYNSFPKMNGQWVADAVGSLSPWWLNLFESHATVQFIHRLLGTLLLISVVGFWLYSRRLPLKNMQRKALQWLLILLAGQYVLGVYTLINVVPIAAASLHQAGACFVLLAALFSLHSFRAPSSRVP